MCKSVLFLLVSVFFSVLCTSAGATWQTGGTDQSGGWPDGIYDGDLNTYGMKDKWNTETWFIIYYNDWKVAKGLKICCADAPGEKPYQVTIESADSYDDVISGSGHFMTLVYNERIPCDEFVELAFTTRRAKAFKVTVRCLTGSRNVRVKEMELVEVTYPSGSETEDVDVTYIERTPRYNYDATKNQPEVGDLVTFTAHVRNRGASDLNDVECKWYIDGAEVSTVDLDIPLSSEAFQWSSLISQPKGVTTTLDWTWEAGDHDIEFVADTNDAIAETSEENNSVTVMNGSKLVAFAVHESVVNMFDDEQKNIGIYSNSWEDWAQRQIFMWNVFLRFGGTTERVALDYIEVWDDSKYVYGNKPFSLKTMDTQWGFPKDGVEGDFYKNQLTGVYTENFNREHSLTHEMSHGLSLIDTYATNFSAYAVDDHTITEEYMQIEQDGEQIGGTIYMPMVSWGGIYEVDRGHMGGGYDVGYCPYHNATMQLYKGQRVKYANANQGGDFYGRYTHRLPHENYFRFLDADGRPLANAQVTLYNYKILRWYEVKQYDNLPEYSGTTDGDGILYAGYNIFIDREASTGVLPYDTNSDGLITWDEVSSYDVTLDGVIDKDDGSSPSDLKTQTYRAVVFKIESDGQVDFKVFECQDMNLAHYAGLTESASYDVTTAIVKDVNQTEYTNVALGKTVTSSPSASGSSGASCLVDGQKFDFMDNYVLGNPAPSAYWRPLYHRRATYLQIDLGASKEVYRINFYPLRDEYGGLWKDNYTFRFEMSNTGDFSGEERLLCYVPSFGHASRANGRYPLVLTFRPKVGRYIRFQICNFQLSNWFALQEIEVMGKSAVYDSDGDTLPDDWEMQYFENLDQGPDDDYDNDGSSEKDELDASTDPTDPDSVFKIVGFSRVGDEVTVEWKTALYEKYFIFYSDDPYSDAMTWNLATERYAGSGGVLSYSETLPAGVDQRYYKLVLDNNPWIGGSY